MPATLEPTQRGTDATQIAVYLDAEVFDARVYEILIKRGLAVTETAKAALVDTDRKSLWRYRERHVQPTLRLAAQWAAALDLPVDKLWRGLS